MLKLAIIGAGASGLAATLRLLRDIRNTALEDGLSITMFESADKIGRSILRSGNGRCNFSNSCIDSSLYHSSDFVDRALSELNAQLGTEGSENPVANMFWEYGLMFREEGEGRLYPKPNKAISVLEVFRHAIEQSDVNILLESRVVKVVAHPSFNRSEDNIDTFKKHKVILDDGSIYHFDAVILAVGGFRSSDFRETPLLDEVPFSDPIPVLCPLKTAGKFTKPLDNIRIKCDISLCRDGSVIQKESGEVLFRKYGVSGIAVFNLSRSAQAGDTLLMDFVSEVSVSDMDGFLESRSKALTDAYSRMPTNFEMLNGIVLGDVASALLSECGLIADAPYDRSSAQLLIDMLKAFALKVEGLGDPALSQVIRGGFLTDAFCSETMEAKAFKGVFCTGEALDVDGPCGGFNLHWAFSSGMLAARGALRFLRDEIQGFDR